MKTEISNNRRAEAMSVLTNLLRKLFSLHADLFYVALREAGFTEDETCRLSGACLRTAKARGLCIRTDYSIKSRRNHSNLQSIWLSKLFGKAENGNRIPETEIKREYARWQKLGYVVPDQLAQMWPVAQP